MKLARMTHPCIGHMLQTRAESFSDLAALAYKDRAGSYTYLTWEQLVGAIQRCMLFFQEQGARPGQKVAVFSPNRYEMLVTELAVMSLGLVSVPLFAGYKQKMVNQLIRFAEVDFLAVADQERLVLVDCELWPRRVIHFDPVVQEQAQSVLADRLVPFERILARPLAPAEVTMCERAWNRVDRNTLALLMFTSGTMGTPKGVLLTHGNILSQQEALAQLWPRPPTKRMLSYLPWHHSFGGIFERFFALYSGAVFALDDSGGKDIGKLLANWSAISPHTFFSVPKVFVEIMARLQAEPRLDAVFFRGLDFVFTAGAPLPATVAETFEERGVPVIEGWGLTETSPCCTLTSPGESRKPGLVGKPIPGVEVRLSEEGELLVRGPNVMTGYYKNEAANRQAFTSDGWFKTGDLGEVTAAGVRIESRKDRIFKLLNAEKVNPAEVENNLLGRCRVIKHVLVFGKGLEAVSALVFLNREALGHQSRVPGCADPLTVAELNDCLRDCIAELNAAMERKYERIQNFVIVDRELQIERGELTPSLKLNPKTVFKNFYAYIRPLYEADAERPDGAIYVTLPKPDAPVSRLGCPGSRGDDPCS